MSFRLNCSFNFSEKENTISRLGREGLQVPQFPNDLDGDEDLTDGDLSDAMSEYTLGEQSCSNDLQKFSKETQLCLYNFKWYYMFKEAHSG
jgi:hypothetical protein